MEEKKDFTIFDVDWSEVQEEKRTAINEKYESFLETHRNVSFLVGTHGTDLRNLILMMFLCLVFGVAGFQNKTILIAIIGMQMIFSLMSRLALGASQKELEEKRTRLLETVRNATR